jgi:hypothetical protein
MMMAFALACWIAAVHPGHRRRGAEPRHRLQHRASTGVVLRDLYRQKRLWWGGLVVSWFWLSAPSCCPCCRPW